MKKYSLEIYLLLGISISIISVIIIYLMVDKIIMIEVTELFFSIFVPIYLFFLAYKLIDKRKIEIEQNKSDIFEIMFQEMLKICENFLLVSKNEGFNKYVIPKINGSISEDEDKFFVKIKNTPLIYEENINHLLENGAVNKEKFEKYINLKNLYAAFISFRITFYDHPKMFLIHQNNLDEFIQKNKNGKED